MNTNTGQAATQDVYDTTYILSDLSPGDTFIVRVFGLNSVGAGEPSDVITVTAGGDFVPPVSQSKYDNYRKKNVIFG